MGKPAGGNTQISFGAWLPILNLRAISVGISFSFSMWNIVMYWQNSVYVFPLFQSMTVVYNLAQANTNTIILFRSSQKLHYFFTQFKLAAFC